MVASGKPYAIVCGAALGSERPSADRDRVSPCRPDRLRSSQALRSASRRARASPSRRERSLAIRRSSLRDETTESSFIANGLLPFPARYGGDRLAVRSLGGVNLVE